jgi:UDP-GlcNAc:undecaprenyl-phosphate GlcNAc-1-phosphate transferase
MLGLGLIDDLRQMKGWKKLMLQIVLACLLAGLGLRVGLFSSFWMDSTVSILVIIGCINALNLLDGMDGLATGVTASACLFFLYLFLEKGDMFGASLSLCLLGAGLAFLFFNSFPAKIFLGDAGSLFVGLVLGLLILRISDQKHDFQSFTAALIICGLPLFDTLFALLRRLLKRRPVFAGDRDHFYDKLHRMGFSQGSTVLISCLLAALFGALGLYLDRIPFIWTAAVLPFLVGLVLCGALRLNLFRVTEK